MVVRKNGTRIRARHSAGYSRYTSSKRISRPIAVAAFCNVASVTDSFVASGKRSRAPRRVYIRRAISVLGRPRCQV